MKPSEIIEKALLLIENPKNWVTGEGFRYDSFSNLTCMCSLGAISAAANGITSNEGNLRDDLDVDFQLLEDCMYSPGEGSQLEAVKALAAVIGYNPEDEPFSDAFDAVWEFNDANGRDDLPFILRHERVVEAFKQAKENLEKENK